MAVCVTSSDSVYLSMEAIFEKVGDMIAHDDHMQKVVKFITCTGPGSGRGRGPKLQPQQLTTKLLLQLEALRRQLSLPWDTVQKVFTELTTGDPLQGLSLKSEMEGVVKEALRTPAADFSNFLETNLELCIAGRYIGPHLLKCQLLRQHMRNPDLIATLSLSGEINNGMIVDLQHFCNKEATHIDRRAILQNLGAHIQDMSDRLLNQKINAILKKYASLRKSANTTSGQMALNKFLVENGFSATAPITHPTRTAATVTATEASLRMAQSSISGLRRHLEDSAITCKAATDKSDTLEAELKTKQVQCQKLEAELFKIQETVKGLKSSLADSQAALQTAKGKIKRIKHLNFYRRLQRMERKLRTKQHTIREHEDGGCMKRIQKLRCEKKLEQTRASGAKSALAKYKEAAMQKIRQLEQALADLMKPQIEPHEKIVRLKDNKGHFLPAAKICIMALVGECEVPAVRCGAVIQTVIRQILDARVPESDLPSQRAALRFSDQAHVLTKVHVADVLTAQDHYDLHIDGTSRSGNKYVCQAVNTPDGTYSLGFTPVAKEDTSTLVEVSMQILEELSDLYPHHEAQDNFLTMLTGLSSLMTDRAAVMKSYGHKLQEERQILLQTEEGLNFLHCNAHFLLGIASEVKKVLCEEDKTRTEAPHGFCKAGECLAYRYIRLACDCLGPRGDDKNGWDAWKAYCVAVVERQSTVTSFRENRFNNTFQGAASLHYHRQDIQDCLERYLTKRNMKIQTVLADSKDEVTDCHLVALGLVYFRIAGPYWQLLGSKVHYLDFYKVVQDLHDTLCNWEQDPSPALSHDCQPVFTGITFCQQPDLLQSLLAVSQEKATVIKALLKKMCRAMLVVTERQLNDFLPGGKYHSCRDQDLRHRLQHSFVTNLVAEESFADLDFSLFKRRNASLHHHATIAMLKKNRSLTTWFLHQCGNDQTRLLTMSAKKANALRKQHMQLEADAINKRKQIMEEERRQNDEAEEKRGQKIAKLINDIKYHNGPCTSVEDVDRLLRSYTTSAGLKAAVRAELLFQKLVLGKKSQFLKVSGKPLNLVNRLRQYFGAEPFERLPPLRFEERLQPRARKRTRHEDQDDVEESEAEESEESEGEAEEAESGDAVFEENFKFSQVGEVIAVYYVEGIFVGEVVEVVSEEEGRVNFLESARGKEGVFRWPSRADCCSIPASTVFARNLTLAPFSSSGRAFIVDSPANLPAKYEAFKKHLHDNFVV